MMLRLKICKTYTQKIFNDICNVFYHIINFIYKNIHLLIEDAISEIVDSFVTLERLNDCSIVIKLGLNRLHHFFIKLN